MDASYFRNHVLLAGAVPAAMLVWDAAHGQLGANAANNALHITGILSLVFLFLSLTITPLRVMTGWNWLVVSRRSLGMYGFFYAILHLFIYVVWDRMGSLASTLEEISSRTFLAVGALAILLMMPLAITSTNQMIRRLGAARWKLLHRLAYVVVILGVMHYYMLVKSDVRQPLAFALVLTPMLGFRAVKHYIDLRGLAYRESIVPEVKQSNTNSAAGKFFRGELLVANIHRETPDVKTFRLVNPHGGEIPFRHQPGQYMTLQLEINGARHRRSYTIASPPSQRGYVELTIKRHPQGVVSKVMHEQVQVGQKIQVAAPGGKFWFDGSTSSRVLLIAGGVGITPTMSILRQLTNIGWPGRIVFLNAARSAEDLIFAKELESLVSRHHNLEVVNFLSQSKPSQPAGQPAGANAITKRTPLVRHGYISASALEEFVSDIPNTPVYLCGPEAMMAAMCAALIQIGMEESQIFTEEFVSPRLPSSQSDVAQSESTDALDDLAENHDDTTARITFARSRRTIEMEPGQTILEAAESNQVRIESECRSGICGQCKVRCLKGRVRMDATEALSLAEKRTGWILACQAKAATESIEIDA